MEAPRRRLGGLGAVFFIASLGAIAFYVQNQAVPEEHDAIRTRATALPQVIVEEPKRTLPWQDRLDLASFEAREVNDEITPPPAASPDAAGSSAAAGDSAGSGPAAGAAQGSDPDADAGDAPPDLARSRYVQELPDGYRILTTIDPVLQDSALQIFRNREVPYGAAVVLDVRDTSVLAMAGHSSMDPQVDPLEILTTAWAPAASTFKIVTASSLLAHGRANARTQACFSGGLRGITDDLLTDNPQRDSKCSTLSAAVAYSHNVVIAKLALKHLTRDQLQSTAQDLGYEREIPFEFPLETSPANIPSIANERAKVAAGFWHVDLNPVHGAVLASVYARGGVFQPPHVVAQVQGPSGADQTPPLPRTERVLSSEVAREVGKMMEGTTTRGTASKSFFDSKGNPYVKEAAVAGKTGSLTGKRAPALNYNWFIGYAPADNPEIAFAVLLANEPKWRIKAHYAARRLVQIYLKRRATIREHRTATLAADGRLLLPAVARAEAEAEAELESAANSERAARPEQADPPAPAAADAARESTPSAEAPHEDDLPPVPGPVAKPLRSPSRE